MNVDRLSRSYRFSTSFPPLSLCCILPSSGALAKWRSRVILLDQRRQHGAPLQAEGVSEEDDGPEGDPSTSFVYSEPWPRCYDLPFLAYIIWCISLD